MGERGRRWWGRGSLQNLLIRNERAGGRASGRANRGPAAAGAVANRRVPGAHERGHAAAPVSTRWRVTPLPGGAKRPLGGGTSGLPSTSRRWLSVRRPAKMPGPAWEGGLLREGGGECGGEAGGRVPCLPQQPQPNPAPPPHPPPHPTTHPHTPHAHRRGRAAHPRSAPPPPRRGGARWPARA